MPETKKIVSSPSGLEVVNYIIYDTETIKAPFTKELKFFSQVKVNRYLSNIEQGGQLAKGYSFTTKELAVKIITQGLSLADYQTIFYTNQPIFSLWVLDKKKLEMPLDIIPAGSDIFGVVANNINNGVPIITNTLKLAVKVRIEGEQNFYATIEWKKSELNPISVDTDIRIMLIGFATRPQR